MNQAKRNRRFELAKAALTGLLSRPPSTPYAGQSRTDIAHAAFAYSDALLGLLDESEQPAPASAGGEVSVHGFGWASIAVEGAIEWSLCSTDGTMKRLLLFSTGTILRMWRDCNDSLLSWHIEILQLGSAELSEREVFYDGDGHTSDVVRLRGDFRWVTIVAEESACICLSMTATEESK